MRSARLALALLLLIAPPAAAAPTCQTSAGDTIRCGTPGAMPVGWKPTPQQLWDREISRPAEQHLSELIKALCIIGLILALIALMPKFDGSKDRDWDPHGDDDSPD